MAISTNSPTQLYTQKIKNYYFQFDFRIRMFRIRSVLSSRQFRQKTSPSWINLFSKSFLKQNASRQKYTKIKPARKLKAQSSAAHKFVTLTTVTTVVSPNYRIRVLNKYESSGEKLNRNQVSEFENSAGLQVRYFFRLQPSKQQHETSGGGCQN